MNFCPHCGGDISTYMAAEQGHSPTGPTGARPTGGKYAQDSIWRRLVQEGAATKGSPPEAMQLVGKATNQVAPAFGRSNPAGDPIATIVHLVMDRNIQPQGGILHRAALLEGKMKTSLEQLGQMGYAVREDKLVTVDDSPVSLAYTVIDYWGGEKQHKRWHLAEPVDINPSRNGDPFFMDENMIAFGAKWLDCGKMDNALLDLHGLLSFGLKNTQSIGVPLALEIVAL